MISQPSNQLAIGTQAILNGQRLCTMVLVLLPTRYFLMHVHFDIGFLKCQNNVFCLPYSKGKVLNYTDLILYLKIFVLLENK